MKRFTLLRGRLDLVKMARFFAASARQLVREGRASDARHFARLAASRYFESEGL